MAQPVPGPRLSSLGAPTHPQVSAYLTPHWLLRLRSVAQRTMAGERVTARKRKAGGKTIIKKVTKKFARHQSDQFMRVPVRRPSVSRSAESGHGAQL